ncbi:hypothetical protein COW81_01070 [Candidatus Campbellbacteria bacterium CG22_combo_CG10-13_8_21_14_all_36_13]|uniref:Uncharacterized protein n=1 Tax=Candidatus Campbellbacteria bacterium CG22_combo_CG10-13_8_21_14_all_36_13 TaxID=1974529 RepID=A0A2H0DYP0_9BACT|nr:MAG: hypothetical protein COW81_01070 [Candidatus Campbellbacteria bacterium CG22_combo_CG10-13_8_21_14_all_36_13]
MKYIYKIVFVFLLGLLLIPSVIFAHMGDFDDADSGNTMMNYVETTAVGSDVHEEMEILMDKMMGGELDEVGANRMVELMNEYPGPYNMMMNRVGYQNDKSDYYGEGMWGGHMFSGGFGVGSSWFFELCSFVWLLVGILLVIFLVKKLTNNK